MKRIFTLLVASFSALGFAQDGAPATPYYNGFNFNQSGTALKNALATKITNTHVDELTYNELWSALKIVDRDTQNSNLVFLVYGYSSNICPAAQPSDNNHRRRDRESNGGGVNCEWNREHIYPQSLGIPELGQSGPGSDAHHLRACDVDTNGSRGNNKYASGTGNAGATGGGWYPGDEWKGDVARILMYMYLHYGNQCLPKNVVIGSTVASDNNMPLLLLQWNAEDPVSPHEDYRNTYLGNANNTYGQGNRNPFIDNPYLATLIWGGPVAQDRWGINGVDDLMALQLSVYPNPAVNNEVNIYSENELDEIQVVNLNGQLVQYIKKPAASNSTYKVNNLPQGFYIMKVVSDGKTATEKIIVN